MFVPSVPTTSINLHAYPVAAPFIVTNPVAANSTVAVHVATFVPTSSASFLDHAIVHFIGSYPVSTSFIPISGITINLPLSSPKPHNIHHMITRSKSHLSLSCADVTFTIGELTSFKEVSQSPT